MNKEFMLLEKAVKRFGHLHIDYCRHRRFDFLGGVATFSLQVFLFEGKIPVYGVSNTLKRSMKLLKDIELDSSQLELINIKELEVNNIVKFYENTLIKCTGLYNDEDEEVLYYNVAIEFNVDEFRKVIKEDIERYIEIRKEQALFLG